MNNIFTVIISVLIGIVAGISLLLGINSTVMNANMPMYVQIKELTTHSAELQKKIDVIKEQVAAQDNLLKSLVTKGDKLIQLSQQRPVAAPTPSPVAAQQPPEEDMDKVYTIPDGGSPIIGKKNAPVTIVMFSDLQCPFCNRFYPPVRDVLKAYPDKVRLIIKHFPLPFHPNARPAAKLTLAANEQGKFKEVMELLLENGADVSEAKVKEYATKAGLNHTRLVNDLKNNDAKYEAQLEEDAKLINSSDVRGTPTFFINGKKAQVRDLDGYKAIIDKL